MRKIRVAKRINEIVNRLNKTKVERKPDLRAEREQRDREEREDSKRLMREQREREKEEERKRKEEAELRCFECQDHHIYTSSNLCFLEQEL